MTATTSETSTLSVATTPKQRKSPKEIEIERLAALDPAALSAEDLRILGRIRDCSASLQEAENERDELKERMKARKSSLEEAITYACNHFENRQLAKQLTLGL